MDQYFRSFWTYHLLWAPDVESDLILRRSFQLCRLILSYWCLSKGEVKRGREFATKIVRGY